MSRSNPGSTPTDPLDRSASELVRRESEDLPGPGDHASSLVLGDQICRGLTRRYARTFYFASHCLPGSVRPHAYAIYAFCRSADNAVDEAQSLPDARQQIAQTRLDLNRVYAGAPVPPLYQAFRRTVQEKAIPRDLFEALLDGMEMDLTISRYATFADLDLYCYRVAGVVGLMMTHLFGYRSERCFPSAVALGQAMQLTNILRDIQEDLERDRIYLPQDELAQFGVTEAALAARQVDEPFHELMRFQIARARAAYTEAEAGIPDLIGHSSRLTVRVMGRLYGGILNAIERQDYDVFRSRARVSTPRKLVGLGQCLARECAGTP